MITVRNGRPTDKRDDTEENVYDILDFLDIDFIRADHSPADTIDSCSEIEKIIDAPICKNLFLTNKKNDTYCLLLMPGNKKYKASKVSHQLGTSRLSFASGEDLMRYLGISPGSVSIMGLINDKINAVTLAIDAEILENEFFGCHPCKNTSTIKIKTSDMIDKFIPYTKHEIKIIHM